MTKEDAMAYLRRWDAVREVEIKELRALTFRQKFSQIEELAQRGRYLRKFRKYKPIASEADAIQAVRDTWAKLRRLSTHAQ